MRALLSDIAAIVTQGRLDNLHKGIELPGKPVKIVEPETKPLMEQEKLNALIASKKPEKQSQIRKPFRGRQQFGIQNVGLQHRREGVLDPVSEKGTNYESFGRKQLEIFDEEAAPPTTAGGTAAVETPPTFPQPPHINQSSSPDIDMGENTWDTNLGIFGRSPGPRRDEGSLRSKHSQSLFQACETRLQDQAREIEYETVFFIQGPGPKKGNFKDIEGGPYDPKKFSELHWESPRYVNYTVSWPPYATTSARTEEQLSIANEIMGINCHIE
ncbi:hypothetical protein AYI69_g8753 [Smittium culicis]|uniref:Uncharacterized protein n=1 Tax=Smittium culicis TaxID=133412 RepID=A0A1R1XHD7_9FUNG|nr:hypothetical protein AYI69_g8753 [Smittium culicis]